MKLTTDFKSKAELSSILSILSVIAAIFLFFFELEIMGFLFLTLSYFFYLVYLGIPDLILSMEDSDNLKKRYKSKVFEVSFLLSSTSLLAMNLVLRKLIFQFTQLIIGSSVLLFVLFLVSFFVCRRQFEKLATSLDLSTEEFEKIYFHTLLISFILGFSGTAFISMFLLTYVCLSYFSIKKHRLILDKLALLFLFICILSYLVPLFIVFPQILAVNEFFYINEGSFILVLLLSFIIFAASNSILIISHFYQQNLHKNSQFSFKILLLDIIIIFILTIFTFIISLLQIIGLLFIPLTSTIFLNLVFVFSMGFSFTLTMIIGKKIIRIRSDLSFLCLTAFAAVVTAWLGITFIYSLPAELYVYAFLGFYIFTLSFLVIKKDWFKFKNKGNREKVIEKE